MWVSPKGPNSRGSGHVLARSPVKEKQILGTSFHQADRNAQSPLGYTEERRSAQRIRGNLIRVFSSSEGTPFPANNFRNRIWFPLLTKARFRRTRIHGLPDTCASLLLGRVVSLRRRAARTPLHSHDGRHTNHTWLTQHLHKCTDDPW